jgi:hypothetical protein
MISALISFLGGSAFRMVFGEISAYFTKKQEHAQEIDRLKLQGELDAAQHARNLEAIRVQSDLGVKVIEVQRDADIDRIEAGAWEKVVDSTTKLTGIRIIDIWNGSIRPALATLAILFVCFEIVRHGFVLSDWNRELFAAILGIYLADRQLQKRGK